MQNVLFRISEPTHAQEAVEFYAVSLSLLDFPERMTVVQEIHGWWDAQTGNVTLDQAISSEPETYESFSEAVEKYCAIRTNRARDGFVHCFSWHSFAGIPTNYKRIEVHKEIEI